MIDNANILIVDDDPNEIAVLGRMLAPFGQLRFATSGRDALRLARQSVPDLVLLDVGMPGMSGFEVCAAMRDDPLLLEVPVILITRYSEPEQEVTGLAMGAVDFISKPLRSLVVEAHVRTHLRIKRLTDALRRAATIDGLTGVANRREFDDVLAREWQRANRAGTPLSLLMIDIDHFKKYNDHYGHQAGDDCLKAVALALQRCAHRPADLAARYGGEEFALLLPDTDGRGAGILAQQVLQAVHKLQLPHAGSDLGQQVSVSIGVAAFDDQCSSWVGEASNSTWNTLQGQARLTAHDFVATADQALYAAKAAGRQQARFLSLDHLGAPEHSRPV